MEAHRRNPPCSHAHAPVPISPRPQPAGRAVTAHVRALATLTALLAPILAPAAHAASPEWGTCKPVGASATHRYSDPGCTSATGARTPAAYEWVPLAAQRRIPLRATSLLGDVRFQTPAGRTIQCEALGGEDFARAEGPKGLATPLWELQQCGSEGQECHSVTAGVIGEINDVYSWLEEPSEPGRPRPGWTGRLGWVTKTTSPPVVGIEYTTRNRERLFDPVSCRAALGTVWIGGDPAHNSSFISTIAPIDQMTNDFSETFASSAPGVGEPGRLENHYPVRLSAFLESHWEPVAITGTFRYRVEDPPGPLELRATR
jgi:hypothetical protein